MKRTIESLKPQHLNCNIISVYDYCDMSMQELLCTFFTKINECITQVNTTFNLVDWLVNQGLELEVAKKLEIWLEDGTLADIIDQELLGSLNEKVTNLISEVGILKEQMGELYLLPVLETNIQPPNKSTGDIIEEYNKTVTENNLKNRLRVGTFNILSFRHKSINDTILAGYIMSAYGLDICGIQEFVNHYDFKSTEILPLKGAMDKVYYRPLFNRTGGSAGQGILSGKELLSQGGGNFTPAQGYEQRGFITSTIIVNGRKIKIFNTHFTHNSGVLNSQEMRELASVVQSDPETFKIVVGDFNNRTLADYSPFTDIGYSLAIDVNTPTIDNILYKAEQFNLIGTEIVAPPVSVSDHKLFIAELEVKI